MREGALAASDQPVGTPDQPAQGSSEAPVDPERWRLSVVVGISMELPSVYPEIQIRESAAPYRELRIPVGLAEGTAIAYAWRGLEAPRPLTHDLTIDLLTSHQVSVEGVRITHRVGQVFFAELETMGPRGRRVVPCRPSDAIALLLRQSLPTPLLVADEVLDGRETGEP